MKKIIIIGIIVMILLISVISVYAAAPKIVFGATTKDKPASHKSSGQGSTAQEKLDLVTVGIDLNNDGYDTKQGDFEMKLTQHQVNHLTRVPAGTQYKYNTITKEFEYVTGTGEYYQEPHSFLFGKNGETVVKYNDQINLISSTDDFVDSFFTDAGITSVRFTGKNSWDGLDAKGNVVEGVSFTNNVAVKTYHSGQFKGQTFIYPGTYTETREGELTRDFFEIPTSELEKMGGISQITHIDPNTGKITFGKDGSLGSMSSHTDANGVTYIETTRKATVGGDVTTTTMVIPGMEDTFSWEGNMIAVEKGTKIKYQGQTYVFDSYSNGRLILRDSQGNPALGMNIYDTYVDVVSDYDKNKGYYETKTSVYTTDTENKNGEGWHEKGDKVIKEYEGGDKLQNLVEDEAFDANGNRKYRTE
ncbi:hypothetical protein KY312_04785 [Candidatus Woesearchaeota archaeon]|nr:hypothetical protein [Candidatus Woesearchaeota archaeon]